MGSPTRRHVACSSAGATAVELVAAVVAEAGVVASDVPESFEPPHAASTLANRSAAIASLIEGMIWRNGRLRPYDVRRILLVRCHLSRQPTTVRCSKSSGSSERPKNGARSRSPFSPPSAASFPATSSRSMRRSPRNRRLPSSASRWARLLRRCGAAEARYWRQDGLAPAEGARKISDFLSRREFHRLEFYEEGARPPGVEGMMPLWLDPQSAPP